jgi:hypothetical protein
MRRASVARPTFRRASLIVTILARLLFALLLHCLAAAGSSDFPEHLFGFQLLPDGPPYSLLDLPQPVSSSRPLPTTVNIHDIPAGQKLDLNLGRLFMRVPDNSARWASVQLEVVVRHPLLFL